MPPAPPPESAPPTGTDPADPVYLGPVYLGIDTATPFLALALWSPAAGTLARRAPRVEREHAARIVAELDALFAAAPPFDRRAIAGIVVGTGPGSYTGLRVGAATARGLARGWNAPLEGGDTLAALAATALDPGGDPVWGVIDARRGNVYAGRYRLGPKGVEALERPAKVSRRELPEDARLVEGVAPDAAALARMFGGGAPPIPRYL